MLEWLAPQAGEKILDVGSGSCWTTALLSVLVCKKGDITAEELVSELVQFGVENYKQLNIHKVHFD